MPLTFGCTITEGKVYRSKKKKDGDEEKDVLRELQQLLAAKNRKQCDCEAQVHDLLENCLNCGRLTCEFEGPGKCNSCGNLILSQVQRERFKKHIDMLQPTTSNRQSNEPRTRIIDNQYDIFTIDNKKYLKDEDRRRLRDNLDELQSQRYKRKMVLEVDVDQQEANICSKPVIDDYESALQNLQLDNFGADNNTAHTLAELVQKEFKKSYDLEYVTTKETNKDKRKTKAEAPAQCSSKSKDKPKARI